MSYDDHDNDDDDVPCDSCGSTEDVSQEPDTGEYLCHQCFEDAWL